MYLASSSGRLQPLACIYRNMLHITVINPTLAVTSSGTAAELCVSNAIVFRAWTAAEMANTYLRCQVSRKRQRASRKVRVICGLGLDSHTARPLYALSSKATLTLLL